MIGGNIVDTFIVSCLTGLLLLNCKPIDNPLNIPTITHEPEVVVETLNYYIPDEELNYKEFKAPKTSGFKSYMPYKAITNKASKQYKLQQKAYTGKYGIRQVDGRYCIAVGSYFTTEIGTKIDLILENGTTIECILADCKADKHTDSDNIVTVASGCMSEFVVDTKALVKTAKRMGDISYANEDWNSPVELVRVYN